MNKHFFSISVLFLLQIFYILDSSKISFINNKFFNNQEKKERKQRGMLDQECQEMFEYEVKKAEKWYKNNLYPPGINAKEMLKQSKQSAELGLRICLSKNRL